MANLSNILVAMIAFFVAAVLLYVLNSTIWSVIDGIDDTGLKLLAMVGYFAIALLILLYFPIHLLTAEDRELFQ